jgi:hypothetical protein
VTNLLEHSLATVVAHNTITCVRVPRSCPQEREVYTLEIGVSNCLIYFFTFHYADYCVEAESMENLINRV